MAAILPSAIIRYSFVAAMVLATRILLPVTVGPAQSGLTVLIYASTAIVAMLVFRPQPGESTIAEMRHAFLVTLVFVIITAADPLLRPTLNYVPLVAITLFLLSATIAIAARYLPMPIPIAVFLLLTLLPVWAAPLVELAGNPRLLTNLVIAASPLTALAVALDLDYLRTGWFYANSALGSMRYEYPGLASVWLVLAVLPASVSIAKIRRAKSNFPIRYAREAKV